MSNTKDNKPISIKWDCPVQRNGAITIPVKIREALGNPKFIRLEISGNTVIIRLIDRIEEDAGYGVQEKKEK